MKQRLFLAIPLPAALKEAVADALNEFSTSLSEAQRSRVRFIPAGNWHVTVYFFGDVPGEHVELLQRQLAPVLHAAPALELLPDQLIIAPPEKRAKSMVWLRFRVEPLLTELSWRLYEATKADFRFPPPLPVLVPHVTVARFKDLKATGLPPISASIPPDPLAVTYCELWDSVLGNRGAVYSCAATFRLGPGKNSTSEPKQDGHKKSITEGSNRFGFL